MAASTLNTSTRGIRYAAAAVAALTAVVYLLIALQVLVIGDETSSKNFAYVAGAGYALGTFMILRFDRRILWILGAAIQVFVIAMYFIIAPQRVPEYEFWGLFLRVPEVILLVMLGYLALRTRSSATA